MGELAWKISGGGYLLLRCVFSRASFDVFQKDFSKFAVEFVSSLLKNRIAFFSHYFEIIRVAQIVIHFYQMKPF
jgi:hypothetical protein